MRNKTVISRKNLPINLPVFNTIITAIALDYWSAPQWLYGAIGLLFLIIWGFAIYGVVTQEYIDLFKDKQQIK